MQGKCYNFGKILLKNISLDMGSGTRRVYLSRLNKGDVTGKTIYYYWLQDLEEELGKSTFIIISVLNYKQCFV